MRKFFIWGTGFFLCFFTVVSHFSWADSGSGWKPLQETIRKSDNDRRSYQAIQLDNQMTVLLISDPSAAKSLAALALPVGSLDDPASQQGLAHYLEHMLLMGSVNYPQPDNLAEFLRRNNGSHNASTAPYRTAFYLEVDNAALEPAVDRLADAIAAPLLDPVYAERERNAVNAELTMARSRDGMRIGQVNAETLNPAHPASQFAGGNLETLSDKPGSKLHDALRQFYQQHYSANLMKAVIYSDKPLAEMAHVAVKTFGRVTDHQTSQPDTTVPLVTAKQQGIVIHYVPVSPMKLLKIDFPIDNNSDQFRSKTDTLIGYLIDNRTGNTLSDWLQKQGLADAIHTRVEPMVYRNGGLFSVSISLTDKGLEQYDTVIAAVFSYIDTLRKEGIGRRYFDEMSHVLAIDFRYFSLPRDMDYIEWLSDMMLRVPVAHILDANWIADRFNSDAITARLNAMTPQNARIWLISPDAPHNKTAYFVDAPYRVDTVTQTLFNQWQHRAAQIKLSLPALNPYIPDDFSLIAPVTPTVTHPQRVLNEPGLRVLSMPGELAVSEPKANIILALRNQAALGNARNQVLFALNDYLAGLALDPLASQASVGGIDFSSTANAGVQFSASGFTQHLPLLLKQMLAVYATYQPDEVGLQQAKAWYLEQLAAAEKGKAFEQALQPVRQLSSLPYTERSERRALLSSITVQELLTYRKMLLEQATPEMMVIGNMTTGQAISLAQGLKQQLKTQGTDFSHHPYVAIDRRIRANFQKAGSSTDSALAAAYIPLGYNEYQSMARSTLLSQVIQPWFYNQLRTEEQLGYAVFTLPASVGRQWGITFLLQSNSKQPAYLLKRYQAFYVMAERQLRNLSAADFAQYQTAVISELTRKPQTLDEQTERFMRDFERGNDLFDSRQKVVDEIRNLTPDSLADFFRQAVLDPQGMALLSQISGGDQQKADYASPTDWVTWKNTAAFQQTLPVRQP